MRQNVSHLFVIDRSLLLLVAAGSAGVPETGSWEKNDAKVIRMKDQQPEEPEALFRFIHAHVTFLTLFTVGAGRRAGRE